MPSDHDCLICGCTSFTPTETGSIACNDCGAEYWPPNCPHCGTQLDNGDCPDCGFCAG